MHLLVLIAAVSCVCLCLGCGAPTAPAPPSPRVSSPLAAPRIEPNAARFIPFPPPNLHARDVAVGPSQACIVDEVGGIQCWSISSPGTPPALVPLPPMVQVAVGRSHACARTESGEVYCWGGEGYFYELGNGAEGSSATPVRAAVTRARDLSASHRGSCVALEGAEISCWGTFPSPTTGNLAYFPTPTVMSFRGGGRASVSFEESHAFGIDEHGAVWAWGQYEDPTLATSEPFPPMHTVGGITGAVDLVMRDGIRCASHGAGASCWGPSVGFVVGFPAPPPHAARALSGAPSGAQLAGGHQFVCTLDASHQVACAGIGDLVDAGGGIWTLGPELRRIGALDGALSMSGDGALLCAVVGGAEQIVRCVGHREPEGPPPPS